jgi:hypothetical protein
MNPYSTAKAWDAATLEAWKSMPLHNGHVVALQYLDQRDALRMEAQWREWCRKTPKHLWPAWLAGWADFKRRMGWGQKATDPLGGQACGSVTGGIGAKDRTLAVGPIISNPD